MTGEKKGFGKKYYRILEKFYRFEKNTEILEMDFEKPWWKIVWDQKYLFAITLIGEICLYSFLTFIPLILTYIYNQKRLDWFLYFIVCWLVMNLIPNFYIYFYCKMIAQTTESVYYNAVKFFLTVDPVFHTTRNSGQIIAKTTRGSMAYEDLLDFLTFDFLKIIVSLITITTILFFMNWQLGLTCFFSFIFILSVSVVGRHLATLLTTQEMIIRDDKKQAVGVETLSSNAFIRASFASNEQMQKVGRRITSSMTVLGTMWMTHISTDALTRFAYILGFTVLGVQTFRLLETGQIDVLTAISLLVTFYNGSNNIWTIGRNLQRVFDRLKKIQDLFDFIRSFGKQSFPVLDSKISSLKN